MNIFRRAGRGDGPSVTVRWSLFAAFALLVVLITGAILTISFISTSRLTNNLARPLIQSAQREADEELHRLFDPIEAAAAVAWNWVTDGMVRRYQPDIMMDLFLPGMCQLPQCVSMMVSDMAGYEFTIFRNILKNGTAPGEVQWTTREFRRQNPPETWPKTARWIRWDNSGRQRLKTWWENPTWTVQDVLNHSPSGTSPEEIGPEDLVYDPRARAWHRGPREKYRERLAADLARHRKEAIYWTSIDWFFTSKAPGMTAGIAAEDPQGDMVVVAYDLLLNDISSFTRALRPTEHAKVFVFTDAGRIVGLPHDERFEQKSLREETILRPVEEAGIPELSTFMEHWRSGSPREMPPFRFQSNGQSWWAGVQPFSISADQKFWVAVAIPELDLIGEARYEQVNFIIVGLTALGLAMVLAWYLSAKFADPLSLLTEKSRRIASLDLTSKDQLQTRLREVRQLSDSLEVVRTSLKSYITEQKTAEKEKLAAQKSASEHEKYALVGQIAGKMAHDFNNILGAIMGNTELALLDCPDRKTEKLLQLIVEQSVRGKNLTKNLVAFASDQEPKQEYFPVNEKVKLVLSLLKKDLEGVTVVTELGEGLPPLLADPGMIEHGLVNVVQNSIHALSHTVAPKIIIRTRQQDECIEVEVEDNGCGIPAAYIERIYDPTFTLKGSRDETGAYRSDIKGTGYGMANVKKYVAHHNGRISVTSEPGKGTAVTINLPVIRKELSEEEIAGLKEEKCVSGKRILLVEDEQAILDVQYSVLTDEPCRHRVDVASDGRTALDLLERNPYDLVSLDYVLPGELNGMDVYEHIRRTDRSVPVLFLSGNLEFLESIRGLKEDDSCVDHASKPCPNKEYIDMINRLLDSGNNRPAP